MITILKDLKQKHSIFGIFVIGLILFLSGRIYNVNISESSETYTLAGLMFFMSLLIYNGINACVSYPENREIVRKQINYSINLIILSAIILPIIYHVTKISTWHFMQYELPRIRTEVFNFFFQPPLTGVGSFVIFVSIILFIKNIKKKN